VDAEDFESGPRWIEITDVQRVAVAKTGAETPRAVRVHDHRVVDDFVTAIAIHVGHADGVRALPGERVVLVLRVEDPALGQLAIAPVPCGEDAAAVVAATHDHARAHAVEIRDAGEEAIDAITHVVIAAIAAVTAPATEIAPLGNVIRRGQHRPGAPVEDGEILRTFEHAAESA
jgi:hypothetical protein